jgi:outer membrane protein assembly factor BamD (BamD/ComL family)
MSSMSTTESRAVVLLMSILLTLAGCRSVPPAPDSVRRDQGARAQNGGDEYDGWLFKSLTGRRRATPSEASEPAAPSAQQPPMPPAPADPSGAPASSVPGPLIPGPASRSPGVASPLTEPAGPDLLPEPPEAPKVGPPPAIPAELPPPPAGAVSMNKKAADKDKSGFEWSDLSPENLWKNAKKATGYGPNEKIARAAMKEGQDLFREKKYPEAAAKFATAADRSPDSPLEEDALFLQGESEFFSDQYRAAHDTYGGLLKKYANTRHLDTVVAREFALGRYWEQSYTAKPSWPVTPNLTDGSKPRFDTFGYAIQAYQRVRTYDPTGPLADDSLMATASAYFRIGQYENAAFDYDLLRKEYPNSEFQMKAHVLGLQAKMRVYQGTLYEGQTLNDAGKIADTAIDQFGKKLGPEYERMVQARAQILEEKANREFTRGEYYETQKYFGAARMYYKSVVADYPSTQKAQEAKTRLEKIRNEPDTPPNRFAWLTGVFESEKKK